MNLLALTPRSDVDQPSRSLRIAALVDTNRQIVCPRRLVTRVRRHPLLYARSQKRDALKTERAGCIEHALVGDPQPRFGKILYCLFLSVCEDLIPKREADRREGTSIPASASALFYVPPKRRRRRLLDMAGEGSSWSGVSVEDNARAHLGHNFSGFHGSLMEAMKGRQR